MFSETAGSALELISRMTCTLPSKLRDIYEAWGTRTDEGDNTLGRLIITEKHRNYLHGSGLEGWGCEI